MSFGRVCVRDSVASGYCPAYASAAAAAAGLLFSFIFYFISFHFISFYVRLFFLFSPLLLLLLLSGAGVMNCFTYTLNMQHMFLAVDVLNIYMQSPCPFCGTFIAKCVCVL